MATKRTSRPKKEREQRATAATVRDVPVTQAMLFGVRDELIERMDGKFAAMDSKFAAIDGKFAAIDGKFAALQSTIHGLAANVARVGVLVEDQNARNAVVMEALQSMIERQDRTEARLDRVEEDVHSLASSVRR